MEYLNIWRQQHVQTGSSSTTKGGLLRMIALYIGVTRSLANRIVKHSQGKWDGFTRKYNCHYLIYYEVYEYIGDAVKREKQLKGWRREKKRALIISKNP